MKPRHGARVDGTQPAIVKALEGAGAKVTVLDLAPTKELEGEPDLLVGWLGTLSLLEAKSRTGRLSEAQKRKHAEWARVGVRVHTVRSEREALAAVGISGDAAVQRQRDMRSMAEALDAARTSRVGRNGTLKPAVRRFTP